MKTAIPVLRLLSIIMVVYFVVSLSSCKKEDDPAYVGSWSSLGKISLDSAGTTTFDAKDLLILSKSSFTELIQLKNPNTNQWVNMAGIKGSLVVSGTSMNFNVKSAGVSSQDGFTGLPTGTITYYQSGTQYFNELINNLGVSQTFSGDYSIDGNLLIFGQVAYTRE